MALGISRVDVWAADIRDRASGLADILSPLAEAGADLECVIARRSPDNPGSGVVFVSPIKNKRAQDAARGVGLSPAQNIATLRIEGADRAGLGNQMMRAIASEGINVRGVSVMKSGNKFIAYIGFDSIEDADRAASALRGLAAPARARTGTARRGVAARRSRAGSRRR